MQEQLRQASGLPVSDVQAMDEVVSRSTSRQRFNMWLMTVFGAVALLLAAIGIYGLMAYSVEQRTQEIGIRLALGAEGGQVKNMVVFQGMRLALAGVVVGLAAASGSRASSPASCSASKPGTRWCSSPFRSCSARWRCWPSGCRRAAPAASIRWMRCGMSRIRARAKSGETSVARADRRRDSTP